MLLKYPTLSLVAVLTLGLGIGLSTTVFCVVNGGLFKGLPFPDADRIVALVATNPSQHAAAAADQRAGPRGLAGAADVVRQASAPTAFAPINLSTEEGRPERFSGGQLTVARVRGARRASRSSAAASRTATIGPGAEPVDAARLRPLARSLRQPPGHRRQDDPRQRRPAHGDRRHAGEVRVPDPRGAVDAARRSIRWRRRAARARAIRSSPG